MKNLFELKDFGVWVFSLRIFISMFLVFFLALASCDEKKESGDSSNGGGLGVSDSTCSLDTGTDESFVIRCVFTESQYPISLQDLETLASEEAAGIGEIGADSEIWIEALGGDGARGANSEKSGGGGGSGGYARWGGTIQELQDNILLDDDGDSLYILVGQKGEAGFNTTGMGGGGSGGSSSLVVGQDPRRIRDELDPFDEHVVLVAGGGGGGGKADESIIPESGKAGGAGGDATSTIFNDQSGAGSDGNGSRNGKGGNQDGKGSGGDGHNSSGNGASGIGGFSGSVNGAFVGWEGLDEFTWEFGNGGESYYNGGTEFRYSGGSGGGGYGGGGGAACCDGAYLNTGYGGGGGGTWVRQAFIGDENNPLYLGKDNMPDNNGDGIVIISIGVIFNSSITIVEEISSGAQSASFIGSGFSDYCSQMNEFSLSNGQSISCGLAASQITITQEVPDGSNISISCIGNSPWSVTNRVVEIDLENNDDMVCTFTNAETQGPTTVFITGNTYSGQLGGFSGADELCNTLAAGAGLDGYFRAWLSDSTGSPSTRFVKSTYPYMLVDGTQIAEDWTDLTSCDSDCLEHIIDLSENGDNVVESVQTFAWTGTASDGTLEDSNSTCNNWTSGSSSKTGIIGGASSEEFWTSIGVGFTCNNMHHLYCFEQ